MRSWSFVAVTVTGVASFGFAGCGSLSTAPTGGSEVVATEYKTLPPPTTTIPPTTTTPPEPGSIISSEATYVVAEGDYPFVVADRFGVDFEEFVALNGWTADNGVVPEWPVVGTTIRIPAGATVPDGPALLFPVATTAADPALAAVAEVGGSTTGTSVAAAAGVGCGTYIVAAGDYLTRVATKLNTTVDKLAAANEGTDGYDAFYIGLKINVPC